MTGVMRGKRHNRPPVQIGRDFLGDFYHALLISPWSQLLLLLLAFYVATNALFAVAYVAGGDSIEGARRGSFVDAFFFSVQTMATIGYGNMVPRTLWAHSLVTLESLVGLLGLALVTGLTFAKFSRPTARVLFSRVAVVSQRDGVPCFMFRMGNQRGNRIVEAHVHVVLARTETTAEGEVVRHLLDLALVRDENPLFVLTWTAIHPIVAASPLHGASAATLAAADCEIVVSLTGLDESFSQTVYARHSYTAADIVWGVRFADVLTRLPGGGAYVDFARFHDVLPLGTAPQLS